jgi:hypothetical protein
MTERDVSLEMLYAQCEAAGRVHRGDDEWEAHAAVLDRLAANRRAAEAAGWTSCAIERAEGAGRFRLFGVPPGAALRAEVPDCPDEAAEPSTLRARTFEPTPPRPDPRRAADTDSR